METRINRLRKSKMKSMEHFDDEKGKGSGKDAGALQSSQEAELWLNG